MSDFYRELELDEIEATGDGTGTEALQAQLARWEEEGGAISEDDSR